MVHTSIFLSVPFRTEQHQQRFQEPVEWNYLLSQLAMMSVAPDLGSNKASPFKHDILHGEAKLNEQERAEKQMNRSWLEGSVLAVNILYLQEQVT